MITLYSQYFNKDISRRLGRRISKSKAEKYSNDKLLSILKELSFNYEVRDCRYPRLPYVESKMFVIDGNVKKSTLLKIIEKRL